MNTYRRVCGVNLWRVARLPRLARVPGLLGGLLASLLFCAALPALSDDGQYGSETDASAMAVLERLTERVLAVIDEARAYVDEDPERYYQAVHEVLDPVVDFSGFARGVMGEYATSERYRGLDEEGREKLREQLDRFAETMRIGLVRTYSKGLLAFGGSRVEFADDAQEDERRATLRQLIYSDQAQPYVVIYTMARNREGMWQIRNLVVENVNLGKIYRSQFASSARRFDGDIDQVIENWDSEARSAG